MIVNSWPLLSVSGLDLGASLTPFSEGAAVGLLNAALALATAVGIAVSGPPPQEFPMYPVHPDS